MTALSEETARPKGQDETRAAPVSLTAKRALVAVVGALLALGGGAGMAYAFRVSPDIAAADAPDQTAADELPSIAAARAYALANPPTYAAPTPKLTSVSEAAVLPDPASDDADSALKTDDDTPDQNAPPSQPRPYVAAFNDGAPAPAAAQSQDGGRPDPS